MKKRNIFRIILIAIIIHLCTGIFVCSTPVKAETSDGEKVIYDTVEDLLNTLDLKELETYLNGLGIDDGKLLHERLLDYIKVEAFDFSTFGKDLLNVLFSRIKELLPAFLCIT